MSPESEARAPTKGSQTAKPDLPQRSSEAAARQLAGRERASGRLLEERATGLSSLWIPCCFVTVASAAAFVACGLWQMGAIVRRVQEVAHAGVVAPATAPAIAERRAQPARAVSDALTTSDPVRAAHDVVENPTQVKPEKGTASSTGPLLTAAGGPSKVRAVGAFEAQAEAPEKAIPVGLDLALGDDAGVLTLGYPPPPDYPRVGCDDVFVYIVTIAEGAPEKSAASLGVGKKGPARLRRPGEAIGDWTVLAITDDWTGLNPSVWLEKDGAACRAELAGNPSRIRPAPKPAPKPPKARRRRRR